MLNITIPGIELYNEQTQEFIKTKSQTLQLEHSLISISKWEAKWCKAFLSKDDKNKTAEETIDYIKCMTLTQNVNDETYNYIPKEIMQEISDYISKPMTATVFRKTSSPPNRELITSELIYYWMIALNIPFECQKWHLNRLLTLINVCNIKNTPPKKMSRADLLNRNRSLNAARRAQLGTSG